MNKSKIVSMRVTERERKDIFRIAKKEKRTVSNLLHLMYLQYKGK